MSDVVLFNEKNEYLSKYYKNLEYKEFYRDVFPIGSFERKNKFSDNKANGIAVVIEKEKYRRRTVTDELSQIDDLVKNNFVIFNGLSYFGKERTLRNASKMYAMIFDIDGLNDMKKLINLISHFTNGISPMPTYLVNSGHGVHLYYVFEDPIPLYNHLKEPLKRMKYHLTGKLWNMYVSDIKEVQYQGINQGFRMVGSPTKFGQDYKLEAFKTGKKITLDYLNEFINNDDDKILKTDYESNLSLSEAREKYPEWYDRKILKKEKNRSWIVKRDLYDWWIRKIKDGATYGHRYFCIMTLSIYATKCNISYEELEKDAIDLIPFLNSLNPTEPFTLHDVKSALNSFGEDLNNFPREDIEKITSIDIPKNKRNGRNQKLHLRIARSTLEIMNEENGAPLQGRKSKENEIITFIENHPELNPTELSIKLDVSRTTIYKYLKIYNNS